MRIMDSRLTIVIIGAGLGCMQAALSVSRLFSEDSAKILLIDRNNYYTFVLLLYQVAAAHIEPELIAYPIRTILRRSRNTFFLRANVERVDFSRKIVETNSACISYDYLVVATGSRTQFFKVPGASDYAFALRTLPLPITLRNHILRCFEQATQVSDLIHRQPFLRIVIVGGGPTGIEIAGTLSELKHAIEKDYPTIDSSEIKIVLVQSGSHLLSNLPQRLGNYAASKLRRMDVEVRFQSKVSRVTSQSVEFQDGSSLKSATVVWAAGLEATAPSMLDEPQKASKEKLAVRPTLQLIDHDSSYAIGDLAYITQTTKPLAGVAPEALQQGVMVARNINNQIQGKDPKPFSYLNKGRLAIIGSYAGVGKIGPFLLTGFFPWLMWLAVHLVYLPGFRNRLLVLLSWLHSYILHKRATR